MKKQKNYFDKHGIRFLIMIPPNKMSVYPELAPKAYRKLKAPYSRYEQTEERIGQITDHSGQCFGYFYVA